MSNVVPENYLILTTTSPTDAYPVDNTGIRANVYTMDEIDALIAKFANDLKVMIDKVIVMTEPASIPNPNDTSLWMEIVDEDSSGEFTEWYNHNNALNN